VAAGTRTALPTGTATAGKHDINIYPGTHPTRGRPTLGTRTPIHLTSCDENWLPKIYILPAITLTSAYPQSGTPVLEEVETVTDVDQALDVLIHNQ